MFSLRRGGNLPPAKTATPFSLTFPRSARIIILAVLFAFIFLLLFFVPFFLVFIKSCPAIWIFAEIAAIFISFLPQNAAPLPTVLTFKGKKNMLLLQEGNRPKTERRKYRPNYGIMRQVFAAFKDLGNPTREFYVYRCAVSAFVTQLI